MINYQLLLKVEKIKNLKNEFVITMVKNKTIAIIGIISYVLSVLASAENFEGVSTVPFFLIVLSAVVLLVFFILAIVRLWHIAKHISIMLIISAISLFFLALIQGFILPIYGSPIIILFNLAKVFNFITITWAVIKLFQKENQNAKISTRIR